MDEVEILEQRSRLFTRMQELLDAAAKTESRSLTGEQETEYQRLEVEFDKADANLKRLRQQAQRKSQLSQLSPDANLAAAVASVTGTEQRGGVASAEYREAFNAFIRGEVTPEQRSLLIKERRALSFSTGSAGGYTVEQLWAANLYKIMSVIDSVRANATVINTNDGDQINYPTADDTSNVGEIVGENTPFSTNADPTFGTVPLKAYKYSSKIILVPIELLQDSVYDMESYLTGVSGERLGRIQNTHFTTGTGTGQPKGIVTGATSGKVGTTGQTTSVIYDDLIDLVYSVSRVYRPQSKFMLADSSIKVVRKLKDSQGRPLWEPSVQSGQADTLLGYPVVTNDNVAAMAANAKSILFGDFKKYIIRDVAGLGMIKLMERYADVGQVGFVTLGRTDGTLIDSAAVKYYANSAT
jgi:HK97 family phage major capsid protein